MKEKSLSRRSAILTLGTILTTSYSNSLFAKKKEKLHLGACDWSVGHRLSPLAFDNAKKIGLEGIQVSYNTNHDEIGLSNPLTLKAIQQASKKTGVKISSLAIGELNRIPYKSEPKTEQWVINSIDAAKALGVKVILLAFFADGDLRNDETGRQEVIRRLKIAGPYAEKKGVILGIESYLTAEEHITIMDAVGSSAVKVYYDFRNAADAGNDVFHEVPLLGKSRICELHIKENGFRLGEGTMDWSRIARMVQDMDYTGWMQIEGATPPKADIVETYIHNRKFLQSTFPLS